MMNYNFFVGWKFEDFQAYAKKHYSLEFRQSCGRTLFIQEDGATIIAIWTRPGDKDGSILAHECVHAANLTLNHKGVIADHINDEAQAYLVQVLVKKALS
jgi:hypothetical protein